MVNSEKPILATIIGRPAMGKGTVCEELGRPFTVQMVTSKSTGEVFRAAQSLRTKLAEGKAIEDQPSYRFFRILEPHFGTMDSGGLIPDQVTLDCVNELLRQELAQPNPARLIIADGFPRTQDQFDAWIAMTDRFKEQGLIQDRMHIGLIGSRETALRRIETRISESGTKARKDDLDATTRLARQDLFEQHLEPIIQRLQDQGDIIIIDGEKNKREVFKQAMEQIVLPHLINTTSQEIINRTHAESGRKTPHDFVHRVIPIPRRLSRIFRGVSFARLGV